MQDLVLKFVSSARAAGLRISTSETLDCLKQLAFIDILNERQFSRVLRANFAKSHRDQCKFNQLYHLFFHELRDEEDINGSEPIGPYKKELLLQIRQSADSEKLLPAVIEFLAGDPAGYIGMLQGIESGAEASGSGGIGSGMGAMVRRMHILLSLNKIRGAVSAFLFNNRDRIDWETREAVRRHFSRRADSAFRLMARNFFPYQKTHPKRNSYDRRLTLLGETPFTSLTRKEVAEMRDAIRALVRKLKDIVTRRYAVHSRGALDVKKTLRKACRYQGIPLEIIYRKKPPRKGRLVVLCDVSGSVWASARFMLNMLYSLQECFTKVRSFIFVAGVDEVSSFFDEHDIDNAIDRVMKDADIEYGESTDYGRTFREFTAGFADILNKKTTLIIIGDGRSNYTHPEAGILDEMRNKCRRLIWLNPEAEMFWYSGDSEMRTYEPLCHDIRACGNLNQLTAFIQSLIL
jgi:uncharacterized protein with von Willebrand factor type A (vWA) domain